MVEQIIVCPQCRGKFKLQARSAEVLRNTTFKCPKCRISMPLSQLLGPANPQPKAQPRPQPQQRPAVNQGPRYDIADAPTSLPGVGPNVSTASASGKTVIAGAPRPQQEQQQSQNSRAASASNRATNDLKLQARPLAGILYSVSRLATGEIFPVYVGRNTIGNEPSCDICLPEASVSPNHALLLIRKIKLEDGTTHVTMNISDPESQYGTFINDQRLEDDVEPIVAGDILQFGQAYQLLFIPVDAEQSGLIPSPYFQATERRNPEPDYRHPQTSSAPVTPPEHTVIYPNVVGQKDEMNFYGRSVKNKEDRSSNLTVQQ